MAIEKLECAFVINSDSVSPEDARDAFLSYMWDLIDYWSTHSDNKKDAAAGAIFSALVTLDGEASAIGGFHVIYDANSDYALRHGFYNTKDSISGGLHDNLYNFESKDDRKRL